MIPFPDDVVVTAVIADGDSDAVVRLLSRSRGRVGAFARRARASRKRFPGLGAPSLGVAGLKERHAADLMELTEIDIDPKILGLANDLRALAHASYLCELVERFLPEHEPAPEIFAMIDGAIRMISTAPSAVLLRAVELKMLLFMGYLPDLHETDLPPVAQTLVHADLHALPAVDEDTLRAVGRLFAGHLKQHGGPPLKSVAFLDAVARAPRSR